MTVDAHLHLWDLERVAYPWLTDALAPINRTFAFAEVEPQLRAEGVDGAVLVQAANSVEDSEAMFAVAASSPLVAGVVAWVDLLDPAATAAQLETWSAHPGFVGVRHLIHDEPDADWLARDAVRRSLAVVAAHGIAFDVIGVLPRHLELAVSLAEEQPELRIVVDHLGTPPAGSASSAAGWEPWASLMTALAAHPNVSTKLSGLTTIGDDLQPYAEHALDAFGASRVLSGGDWPVSTLAGTYAETTAVARALTAGLSEQERTDVFGGAARRAYRLG